MLKRGKLVLVARAVPLDPVTSGLKPLPVKVAVAPAATAAGGAPSFGSNVGEALRPSSTNCNEVRLTCPPTAISRPLEVRLRLNASRKVPRLGAALNAP